MSEKYKNYIHGEWVLSSAEKTQPNINPADTSEVLGLVVQTTREETRAAIDVAERALEAWRDTPAPARGRYIDKVARLMSEQKSQIARMLTREEGKILREAEGEVQKTINILEFMAGESRRWGGETTPSEMPNTFCYTVKQPIGVVGIITPWNFPVCIPCWKIAPALIAGNTVVFKPASITPGTAVLVTDLFHQAGLPPGVLNLVMGSGSTVGDEIVNNPKVRALSFTGSNEVGTRLYEQGAAGLKKVQCEMGGKNPIVVLEDADVDLAVDATAQGAFGSTGQRCTATSRAIVVDAIADEFVAKLVSRAKAMTLGNGLEPGVGMGPSVDENQMNTVLKYLEIGKQEGAKLLAGGGRATEGALAKGYFVQPTIFDHVGPDFRIAQEEIFGPVISVIRVRDFEEALAAANNCAYGLTSSIYSNDVNRVFRFLDKIETGITHVNSPTMGGEAQLPFGGVKGTGVGDREQGKTALDFYSEIKTVYVDFTGRKRETNIY